MLDERYREEHTALYTKLSIDVPKLRFTIKVLVPPNFKSSFYVF